MPTMPPTRCPRCKQLFTGKKCPNHNWERATTSWKRANRHSPLWRGLRAWRLEQNPVCQWPGCTDLASQVDHLDGTDYEDNSGEGASWLNPDMTRSLCQPHHAKRTSAQGNAAQRGQRGR